VLLDHWGARLADPREVALLHELVLGVLRHQALLDSGIASVASRSPDRIDPEVHVALRIGAYALFFHDRVPDFAAVDSAVELLKKGPRHGAAGFANGVLRALSRCDRAAWLEPAPHGDVAALARRESHPAWWVKRLVGRVGWEETVSLLKRNNEPAPTVLRVNGRVTTSDQLREILSTEGIDTRPCRHVPGGLRTCSGNARRSRALAEGQAWVQDEAAQIVAFMLGRPLGRRVADLCAAPGGKTMQLAEWLPEDGILVAADRHHGRLRRMTTNLRRVGARGVSPVLADMARGSVPLRGPFDQILLDAPCSGSGTLRRRPEIRWRLQAENLKLLAARQRALLGTAAALLAPGGRLVYAVCSMEPEEGEEMIATFLQSKQEFRKEDPRPALPVEAHRFVGADLYLRTSPAVADLDGFFAALLVREGGRQRATPRKDSAP
jgi:16S rRNA (cytosine967-C5)-methyltransferase